MTEKEAPDAPFDAALEGIRQGRIEAALDALVADLDRLRRGSSPEAWNRVVERARAHPVSERILRDPFVQRCFAKPRGYAADGIALDYILRARDSGKAGPAERLHRRIVEGTTGRALRFRVSTTWYALPRKRLSLSWKAMNIYLLLLTGDRSFISIKPTLV